jgi:hypothetical protein
VFFTLIQGCECQMKVVRAAEAQMAVWPVVIDGVIPVLRVDFSRWPDLSRHYDVARSPALVLLNAAGEVVWKQDLGLNDEAPLDLETAKYQIENFLRYLKGGRHADRTI